MDIRNANRGLSLAVVSLIAVGGGRAVATTDRPPPAATVVATAAPVATTLPPAPPPTEPTTTVPVTAPPAPPTTVRPPVTTVPRPRPVTVTTKPRAVTAAAPAPAAVSPSDCSSALAAVQASGLRMPAGVPFVCPQSVVDSVLGMVLGATHRSGSVQGQVLAVEIDLAQILALNRPGLLVHVIAHELCHVAGVELESEADACAASHGFPLI